MRLLNLTITMLLLVALGLVAVAGVEGSRSPRSQQSPNTATVFPTEDSVFVLDQMSSPLWRCSAGLVGSGDAVAMSVTWGSTRISIAFVAPGPFGFAPGGETSRLLTSMSFNSGFLYYVGLVSNQFATPPPEPMSYPLIVNRVCLLKTPESAQLVGVIISSDGSGHPGYVYVSFVHPAPYGGLSVTRPPSSVTGSFALRYLEHRTLFVTQDASFPDPWTTLDAEAFPLRVMAVSGDRLVDVTQQSLGLVGTDA